jgi:Cof subfamily protein (haloacid dehalogenase superfamily)
MVVFFDIDGTLVDYATQVIPESTIRAVNKLKENGHIPVVNTGRPFTHIDPRVRAMNFTAYICACGMETVLNGQWLSRRKPEPEVCRIVRDAVRECNMYVSYESDHGILGLDGRWSDHPMPQHEAAGMRSRGFTIKEIDDFPQPEFIKFCTYTKDHSDLPEFLRRMEPYFDMIDRVTLQEFTNKGCSKAAGMLELLAALGISAEETMAIGDSTNDSAMFAVAKHTVCMGDGMEELKREAEYITANVMDDGIEKALQHFGLI